MLWGVLKSHCWHRHLHVGGFQPAEGAVTAARPPQQPGSVCDPLFPSSTLKLWDYSKGKVSSGDDAPGRVCGGRAGFGDG